MKTDLYQRVTDAVISLLEQGAVPGSRRGMPNMLQAGYPVPCAAMASPIRASTFWCSGWKT